MNKTLQIVAISLLSLTLIGCQSNEKKAAALIKDQLSKTLYDFESYQPIETIVKEAKMTIYNDTTIYANAAILVATMNLSQEYLSKANDALDHMRVWGPPTSYSSSYSDSQYNKYREESDEDLTKAKQFLFAGKEVVSVLKERVAELDTSVVIGWEVIHRFRCKTKGGSSAIGDYRYIIDKKFKTIILMQDLDDENEKEIKAALKSLADGELDWLEEYNIE